MKYALGFCLIRILHFAIHISHVYWLALIHQIVWITFFLYVAYYELHERLQAPQTTLEAAEKTTTGSISDRLREQTIIMLNCNDKWRSPELSLTSLAEQLESNRTYVGYRKRSTAYRNIPNRIHREHQAQSPSTLPNITPILHDKMGDFCIHTAPCAQSSKTCITKKYCRILKFTNIISERCKSAISLISTGYLLTVILHRNKWHNSSVL